jgi:hypothetical protein
MSALILENLKSKVIGMLQVFGDRQDADEDKPAFEVNPGADSSGGEVTVRKAFRVRKSTAGTAEGETIVFEVLPNGNVSILNELKIKGGTVCALYSLYRCHTKKRFLPANAQGIEAV